MTVYFLQATALLCLNDRLETELPEDAVLLDETSYSTNIDKYVRELVRQGTEKEEWKFWMIQWVAESPNSAIKRVRKRSAIDYLGVPKRTFEDWLKKHLDGEPVPRSARGKKPKHDLTLEWEPFITSIWNKGSKGKKIMSAAAVYKKVEREALDTRKTTQYPSYATVRRILQPLIERKRTQNGISSAGQGMISHLPTRAGETLTAKHSNHVVEIDHTKVDRFALVAGDQLKIRFEKVEDDNIPPKEGAIRLYLSVLKDVFSKCILSHLLSIKQPSAEDVAQLIRKAILPKEFPPDYDLPGGRIPYGSFSHLYVDGGKDLNAEHIKRIGKHLKRISPGLGFIVHLRRKPSDGGDVESVFNGLNKRVWSEDPSYTGSNTTQRPKDAQAKACLTLRDTDKVLSWYFYVEYNLARHTKDPTELRYTKWLEGMDGELPPVIDERKLDACLRKLKSGMVYKHGIVQFKTRRYQGEFLKAFAGQKVTLRYDSSDILRLFAYELETDGKPGRFLGYAEMQDVDEINYWIRKLQLPLRELDLDNLESETLTLEALEYVLSEAEARGKALDNTTKAVRVKYRGKRQDLVAQKNREASNRNRQSQSKGKGSSKPTIQTNNSSIDARPSPAVIESIGKIDSNSDSSIVALEDDVTSIPLIVEVPEPQKVISIQEKRYEKNIESFKEHLKVSETSRPKLVVPRRKGRSR